MDRQYHLISVRVDCCLAFCVGRFFDIVSLMKGHVGDGAWSGGFKAPGASFQAVTIHVLT